jgi:hypothetical protein
MILEGEKCTASTYGRVCEREVDYPLLGLKPVLFVFGFLHQGVLSVCRIHIERMYC